MLGNGMNASQPVSHVTIYQFIVTCQHDLYAQEKRAKKS